MRNSTSNLDMAAELADALSVLFGNRIFTYSTRKSRYVVGMILRVRIRKHVGSSSRGGVRVWVIDTLGGSVSGVFAVGEEAEMWRFWIRCHVIASQGITDDL